VAERRDLAFERDPAMLDGGAIPDRKELGGRLAESTAAVTIVGCRPPG
jgi:hypothetical protein